MAVLDSISAFEKLAIQSGITFNEVLGDAKKFTIEFIRLQLAQATAAAIKNAFVNSPLGPITGAALATTAAVAVNSLFSKFVEPIAPSNVSVSSSGTRPTAVGNREQTVNVNVTGKVAGRDIIFVVDEERDRQNAVTGG